MCGATSLLIPQKLGADVTFIPSDKLATIDPGKFDIAMTVMGENHTEMMGDIVMNDYPYQTEHLILHP